MTTEILYAALLTLSFLALFGIAELLYHKLHVPVEFTRKGVHTGTGLLTLLFPVLLHSHWTVLFLCASFGLLLLASIRFHFLPSINAIERESVGSLAYPVAVYGCYVAFWQYDRQYLYFYLPILILTFCDPIAALVGRKWPIGPFKVGTSYKTLMGSGMFLLSAFALTWLTPLLLPIELSTGQKILIALSSTLAEAVSRKGYDNSTIPASVLVILMLTT